MSTVNLRGFCDNGNDVSCGSFQYWRAMPPVRPEREGFRPKVVLSKLGQVCPSFNKVPALISAYTLSGCGTWRHLATELLIRGDAWQPTTHSYRLLTTLNYSLPASLGNPNTPGNSNYSLETTGDPNTHPWRLKLLSPSDTWQSKYSPLATQTTKLPAVGHLPVMSQIPVMHQMQVKWDRSAASMGAEWNVRLHLGVGGWLISFMRWVGLLWWVRCQMRPRQVSSDKHPG